jgi:homoserine dehydrogenase
MEQDGTSYADALAQAQKLGYAESDPTLDVNGHDTAHKLALLARIAFLMKVPVANIRCEGIQKITAQDIASARTMGSRIKLLAMAKARPEGVELCVAPTLVPIDHPLAAVSRNYNGVYIIGDASGPMLFTGQGAGALPTASAVLADVVELATGSYQATAKTFQFLAPKREWTLLGDGDEVSARYARFVVPDRAGILAGLTNALSSHQVSVQRIHQGTPVGDGRATIEVVTHPLEGKRFDAALANIAASGLTVEPAVVYRSL